MKSQLLSAWRTNNEMNLLLIDQIDEEGMKKSLSNRGGRTIYLQLLHANNVRLIWLETCAKDIFRKNIPLDKDAPMDIKKLRKAYQDTALAIEEFINKSWEEEGKVKGFNKGLIPFIAYLISHESHHRGQAVLTLKQSGIKLSDSLKWGLWKWDSGD